MKMGRLRPLALFSCFLVAEAAATQELEQTVLVRRVVPANFHDPEFDQSKFDSLLAKSASRAVVTTPGSTVSGVLREQFNISQSWTPALYSKLEAHVLAQNNMRDPTRDLKVGQLLKLPDLPRTAQVYLETGQSDPSKTRSSIAADWDKGATAFYGSPRVGASAPATAATELQIRLLPASALKNLHLPNAATPYSELAARYEYQVMNEPMALTLAGEPQDAVLVTLLNQAEKASLGEFLKRPARRKPILVILDDGFPSQSDFFRAADFVINASREIRQKFGLQDAAHGDSSKLVALARTYRQGTRFCDEDCEYPTLKTHSAMIRESLRELTELDASQRVEVIYLPFNAAQPFSREILAEILNVALLADSVTDGLVLTAPGIKAPANLVRGTPDYSSIAPQIEVILNSPGLVEALKAYTGGVMTAQTDKGIIDGVVNFLWLYSMASQRPHFLSMSWTSANLKYPTLFRPNGYGLWLAAAGNDPVIDIHAALRQFAARSADPGDVLAVENVVSACPSSVFSNDPDVPVFGIAFPGRISTKLCGTSFSTPRIGWLLAAYEAIKGEQVQPYTPEWETWRVRKRSKLMALQASGKTGELRYRASPWQLLGEPTP